MSNIKLSGHSWATDGVYDTTQQKTQKAINAELYAAITTGTDPTGVSPATEAPLVDGATAVVGTSVKYAREDHVHPKDSTKANVSTTVTNVAFDSTNGKFTKTINGTTTDVVTLDAMPTQSSKNPVQSGGVFDSVTYIVSNIVGDGSLDTTANTLVGAINEVHSSISGKPNLESTTDPAVNGTAAVGTATTASRSDHVHPTDTTRQPKNLYFANKEASSWTQQSTPTYSGYPYRCSISCAGVTANMYAEVIFAPTEALSGNYAPVCQTYGLTSSSGGVYIYSKVNTTISIPTIVVFK